MPWSVIGFWNAAIGFILMRFARDPVATVMPSVARVRGDEPITASTAITIFVRNEPPDRVIRNLDAMMREIDAAGAGSRFHLYVLSDTNRADIASLEENGFRGARRAMARPHRGDLPPPRTQHRLQGGKLLGFLPALGRPARIRRHPRHRQLHDRRGDHADGAGDPGRSEARHSAGPCCRPALDQRVRPHLPVRHAARHAVMDHRQRLVAGRLRPQLGPQRHHPDRAVRRALPHPEAARGRRARRRRAEPRPDRGGADAPRRLRRARAAGGGPWLGGEPADLDRVHPPRPALVPGHAAIRPFPVAAGHEDRQPLPACLRHADVSRLAGLDRLARGRHRWRSPPRQRRPISSGPMPAMRCSPSSSSCGSRRRSRP